MFVGNSAHDKIIQMGGENMLCKMDIKYMCGYIDRTDRPLSKEMELKKKSGGQYKIEKLRESKVNNEVNAGVIRIYIQSYTRHYASYFAPAR